ncbi:MAG: hypothetical protein DRN04_14285 [Thermoprotei archaeon]|nr:MAG: hypothetical protein DRN04_14285 [Thermoprotei archaeon]
MPRENIKDRLKAAELLVNAGLCEQAVLHINSALIDSVTAIAEKEGLKNLPLSEILKKLSESKYPYSKEFKKLLELSRVSTLDKDFLKTYIGEVKKIIKIYSKIVKLIPFSTVEFKTPLEKTIAVYKIPLYSVLLLLSIVLDALALVFPWTFSSTINVEYLGAYILLLREKIPLLSASLAPLIAGLLSAYSIVAGSLVSAAISAILLGVGITQNILTYGVENIGLGLIAALMSLCLKAASCIIFGRKDLEVEIEVAREDTEAKYIELEIANPQDPSAKIEVKCRVDLSEDFLILPYILAKQIKLDALGETEVKVKLFSLERTVPAVISSEVDEAIIGKTALSILKIRYNPLSGQLELKTES